MKVLITVPENPNKLGNYNITYELLCLLIAEQIQNHLPTYFYNADKSQAEVDLNRENFNNKFYNAKLEIKVAYESFHFPFLSLTVKTASGELHYETLPFNNHIGVKLMIENVFNKNICYSTCRRLYQISEQELSKCLTS